MKNSAVLAIVTTLAALSSGQSFAQTQVGPISIKSIATGWNSDTFGISTGTTAINPANCASTDVYASTSADSGYKTYYAAALTAVSTGINVSIVVDNGACASNGRPRIMGLTLSP
jgi:hypothetical protein